MNHTPIFRIILSSVIGLFLAVQAHAVVSEDESVQPVRTESQKTNYGAKLGSKSDMQNLLNDETGVSIHGTSGGFDSYLNDAQLLNSDDDILLLGVDQDSNLVLGAEDAPAGVSFKKGFETSPLE